MELQIGVSTVRHMLDLVLKQGSFKISSMDEKMTKKQKLIVLQEAELPANDMCRGDSPVYILGSFLDVLLLKKDITTR